MSARSRSIDRAASYPRAVTATIDDQVREQLLVLLDGVGAHMPFDEAVADFPTAAINTFPPNVDYTPWHLLEHVRITQADILDYIVNRDYQELDWPGDYWPPKDAVATRAQFDETIEAFKRDRAAIRDIVADPATDVLAVIDGTPGHTILREVRIVADHNAYHVGEFAVLRQIMSTWPPDREE
jgi:DinB family protein